MTEQEQKRLEQRKKWAAAAPKESLAALERFVAEKFGLPITDQRVLDWSDCVAKELGYMEPGAGSWMHRTIWPKLDYPLVEL